MHQNQTLPKPADAEQEGGKWLDGMPCSQLREPLEAPRDGTFILGAFGWPWLAPAVWNSYDQEWVVCHMQAQEMANGLDDRWLEMEREKALSLTGWLPVPPLPGGYVNCSAVEESTTWFTAHWEGPRGNAMRCPSRRTHANAKIDLQRWRAEGKTGKLYIEIETKIRRVETFADDPLPNADVSRGDGSASQPQEKS